MKREPRLERLEAASRQLRKSVRELDGEELAELQALLERLLEKPVLDRPAVSELEKALLR